MAPRNVLVRGIFTRIGFCLIQHPAKVLLILSSGQEDTRAPTHKQSASNQQQNQHRGHGSGIALKALHTMHFLQCIGSSHLVDGIRANVVGHAHPHFVYILHQKMPKTSCLELDWRLRLQGLPHILKCDVEQAVLIQARAPGWKGRVLEGWWWCCRARSRRRADTRQNTWKHGAPCVSWDKWNVW